MMKARAQQRTPAHARVLVNSVASWYIEITRSEWAMALSLHFAVQALRNVRRRGVSARAKVRFLVAQLEDINACGVAG